MGTLYEFKKAWCDICGKEIKDEYEFYPLTNNDIGCHDCWSSYLDWKIKRKEK